MKTQDSEAYACLLNVLAPECSAKPSPMSVKDLLHRARLVLEHADRMGCKRYLAPKDIVAGLQNLNLAFVAHIFQKRYVLWAPLQLRIYILKVQFAEELTFPLMFITLGYRRPIFFLITAVSM